MSTRLIRAAQRSESDLVREVAACVRAGGTIIFPTETVYGLGCDPEDESAIDAIYDAKGRDAAKPLALHVADVSQAFPFVDALSACARAAMQKFWPGPLAIVVRRKAGRYERASGGRDTISLRCPDHALCRALLQAAGPLAATSANRSGRPPFGGDDAQLAELPEASLAVLAGPTPLRKESTIVDCTGDVPVVIREGAIAADVIVQILGTSGPVR
jgi:L-threonylcarbamoyladenylate synthase